MPLVAGVAMLIAAPVLILLAVPCTALSAIPVFTRFSSDTNLLLQRFSKRHEFLVDCAALGWLLHRW
jgi:hypothetical protein